MKALIHANLFDFDTYMKNQYVLFDNAIRAVGPMDAFPGAAETIDCAGGLILPGFVLGHAHIYSAFSRGWNTPFAPRDFKELLEQLWWKLDAGLNNEATYASGLFSAVEYAKNGVTTIFDHHASGLSIHGSLEALRRAVVEEGGLRGVFCFETSERFPLQACIEENVAFAQSGGTDCAGMFGMHALMTLSDAALVEIAQNSGKLPIHIHVAESVEDEYKSLRETGRRIVPRLLEHGLLRPGSILAHGVHLDAEEIALLGDKGLYMALNPTSNMNNGVGLPDVHAFMDGGLRCILGNDGLGYNITRDMQNLIYCLHHRYGDPLAASFDTLKTVLRNTYTCAEERLHCRLGHFAPGYEADMQFVPYTPPTPLNVDNIWGHLFYGVLDAFRPKDVWCKGRAVLTDYRPHLDEQAVCEQARATAAQVWQRIRER